MTSRHILILDLANTTLWVITILSILSGAAYLVVAKDWHWLWMFIAIFLVASIKNDSFAEKYLLKEKVEYDSEEV